MCSYAKRKHFPQSTCKLLLVKTRRESEPKASKSMGTSCLLSTSYYLLHTSCYRCVGLEGIFKNAPTAHITKATQVQMTLVDTLTGHMEVMEASFGEMDDCADPILVGFLDLAGFGYSIREDDDGHIWVTVEKLGVTCLVER